MPGKKRDRNGILVTETFSQTDVIYESSGRVTLNDTQKAARKAFIEDNSDDNNAHRVHSAKHEADSTEEMAWKLHDLQDCGR